MIHLFCIFNLNSCVSMKKLCPENIPEIFLRSPDIEIKIMKNQPKILNPMKKNLVTLSISNRKKRTSFHRKNLLHCT